MEGVGVVRIEEVGVEADGGGLLLNGGENGAGVLQEGGAEVKERMLGNEGRSGGEERLRPEKIDGCEFDELGSPR